MIAPDHEKIQKAIRAAFPENGVKLGALSTEHTAALGLRQVPTVRLARGGHADFGISHNWRHHKEMFTDLADSQRVLEETIGNPKARCVLSLAPASKGVKRVVVIHNPDTGAYCVLNLSVNGKDARLVSWHRAKDKYGNNQWSKN